MNNKVKAGLIIGLFGIVIAGGVWYLQPKVNTELELGDSGVRGGDKGSRGKGKSLNVNALVLRPQPLTDGFTTTGLILPDEEVDLSFETSGKITSISFKEGSVVRKGQLLAKVNDRPLQAQLRQLQTKISLARNRVYRQEQLLRNEAASREAYEEATTELATLEAEIEAVKVNIGLTELRAPFDGVLGLRQVSVGAYATPSLVVAKLTKITPLKIEFSVPERYANDIRNGQGLEFTVDGFLDAFQAKVYAVESAVDKEQHVFTARALYPNSGRELKPGQYASIRLTRQELSDALVVPAEAIVPEMGIDKVFCYRGGKAVPVDVKAGIRTDAEVQVLSGLEVGDTIITSGTLQLRTDLPVTLDVIE
ncbi:MAG: efflux RND transporter periplasmic adaptor subunit [Bacteroidaceae bacterium]|nr:efflux RND transporter periplasmic adaptor subunit [Bacteroidaceae bacterium]